jgi:hypothetical protein
MQSQETTATSLRESALLKASSSLPSFKSLESSIVGSNDSSRCCKESTCNKQKLCQKNPRQFLHQVTSLDKPFHFMSSVITWMRTWSGRPPLSWLLTGIARAALTLAFSASDRSFFWPSANSPFKESASKLADVTVSCTEQTRNICEVLRFHYTN